MSNSTKWIVGLVVVIIVGYLLWSQGIIGGVSQSAAVINTTAMSPTTTGESLGQLVKRNLSNIDAKMKASNAEIASLGSAPSSSSILLIANHYSTVALLLSDLRVRLESMVVNLKATSLSPALADLGVEISNASSVAGVVASNVSSSSDAKTLAQAVAQLKITEAYLNLARIDVQTITKGLGIK